MLLKQTNIEDKLAEIRQRSKSKSPNNILKEVRRILSDVDIADHRIQKHIKEGKKTDFNAFDFDALDPEKMYHIDQIKKLCIDYRLRFLNSKYFKGKLPKEAISKIEALENLHDIELTGFKIMAPSKLFKLEDMDDPVLFVPIGNEYFYLVHKWGNDLHPLRKILMWPFKSMVNLTAMVLAISYFVTLLVPEGLFSKNSSTAEFWIIYFFMFKCIASVVIFYGFALGKNFTPAIWNSKYFNA